MDKTQIKQTVHGVANKAAAAANEKAKASSGWTRWLWAIGAIIAAAVAWFTQGCTPANGEQLKAAHAIYHVVSGKPCKFSPVDATTVK
jgi:hypothetical protein